MFFKSFEAIKYKFIRYIESNYKINLLIYNNIHLFKFLLPHEKDYYGMLLICKNSLKETILDIGASLGISSLGFRSLGFKNKIYAFEPNYYLYQNYLKKNFTKDTNIFLKKYCPWNKNISKNMYFPFYNSNCIHYFSSFDKKYLLNSIKITFPNVIKNLKIKKKILCRKYDDLNLKIKPHFIKIDTEGFDQYILMGMKETIMKYKPIFLIEYNKEYFNNVKNFKTICSLLLRFKKNKMIPLPAKINQKKISRSNKKIFYQ